MKKLLFAFLFGIVGLAHCENLQPNISYNATDLQNAEHRYPMQPVNVQRNLSAFSIYCDTLPATITVGSFYIRGASDTTSASYLITNTSITFYSAGGLYAGSTYWIFSKADEDTITEGVNYMASLSTMTPGIAGGIVISTNNPLYGNISSFRLKSVTSKVNCLGVGQTKNLVVTSSPTDTMRYSVTSTSISFFSNGLFAGNTGYTLADYTIEQLISKIRAIPYFDSGVEGTLKIGVPQGSSLADNASTLVPVAATVIGGSSNVKTLLKGDTVGLTYTLYGSSLPSNTTLQWRPTKVTSFATINAGTTVYLKIYDGAFSTNTLLYMEKLPYTDTSYNTYFNGDFAGGILNAMRFDIVGTTSTANVRMNLSGHRR